MTKEQQIEELTKLIQTKEIYPCGDDIPCADCYCACKGMAEMIYELGYRKVPENERFVSNMKNVLEIEKENAVKAFAEKLKKYKVGMSTCQYGHMEFVEVYIIDELLKEYER